MDTTASPGTDFVQIGSHNASAEQWVLGGLMLDPSAWDRIGDLISESDFYSDDHRKIYRAILTILDHSRVPDLLTVTEELSLRGELDRIGGQIYLATLLNETPSAANIRRHAEIIRERALMRGLASAGHEIAESVVSPAGRSAKTLLDQAETKIFQIAENGARGGKGFQPLIEPLTRVIDRVDELYKAGSSNPITGMATGFSDLDEKTAGLQKGDLIIVAGRPSMGKTAFALNIAAHVGVKEGKPVAIFSMEMSSEQLAMRLLGSHGRLDQQALRTGQLKSEDFSRMSSAMGDLSQAPIYIDETGAMNPLDLRAKARRLHRQYDGLGLIVVDYLQLMTSARGNGENRATEISEISRSLKALAKELNVPVVALSQLNRSLEQRQNRRPVMSDLRESGAIEQDADVILFIYRDEVYDENSADKGTAEIIIGKQRNGPTGTVRLVFLGHYTRFENFGGGEFGGHAY
jgi:replicative DNA helicase